MWLIRIATHVQLPEGKIYACNVLEFTAESDGAYIDHVSALFKADMPCKIQINKITYFFNIFRRFLGKIFIAIDYTYGFN